MAKRVKTISNFIFYLFYLVVIFFVRIGEITKSIFFLPYKTIIFLRNKVNQTIYSFKKQKVRLTKVRLTKFYIWRLTGIKLVPFLTEIVKQTLIILGKSILWLINQLILLIWLISKNFFLSIYIVFKNIISGIIFFFNAVSIKIRYFILGFLICLLVIFFTQIYFFAKNLPSPNNIGKINYSLSSHIFDRNGKLLYEIYREQNRTPIKINDLPPYVYQATIAIEDKDFYRHNGISIVGGVLRAIKEWIFTGQLQGGSTITQQLVKTALLSSERTIERKVKEIILALWTEQIYTKEQILEMYLNQVPYGGSTYGIEEAAITYFNKHANELSLPEAALLAGLPMSPSLYSPYNNPDLAIARRRDVLNNMKKLGYIDEATKNKAIQSPLEVYPPRTIIKAPHFVFYVKAQLEKEYGIKKVEEGGLRVITTLDLDLQNEAEKILKEELDKIKNLNVTNGAILITRPSTGEILAMVGSYDYFKDTFGAFNVTTALRQPGSAIKPLMYSLALSRNYTAATVIDDSPVVFVAQGAEPYRPVNYDGVFHGRVPLRYALANSYNVPAVKVLNTLGIESFVNHAKKMGISTWNDSSRFGLSLTLGGGEVTMIDMARAYGVFANQGYRVDLTSTLSIEDTLGQKILTHYPLKTKVLDSGVAFIISDILSDNFARQWAFGPKSALEIPGFKVAVKTGTTNDKKDNWTIGYTPEFLVAVWVGNNDNSPMNPLLTSGVTGAAPIWNRVMSYVLRKYGNDKNVFEKPPNVVEKKCFFGRTEFFLKGTENKAYCGNATFNQTPTPIN
ncbi:MAG: PBP1A family penicillin-binding protein [Microgenomates group bacterium]|nr:PBP1A family penicillin-binding protein [Microgenomates group bacterium]